MKKGRFKESAPVEKGIMVYIYILGGGGVEEGIRGGGIGIFQEKRV